MFHVITCPSGLTGRVRGMKAREEPILVGHKLAKSDGQVDELLGACWEETLGPGPYDFAHKGIDWCAVLQGRPLLRAAAGPRDDLRARVCLRARLPDRRLVSTETDQPQSQPGALWC